jgi:hypothetical protein
MIPLLLLVASALGVLVGYWLLTDDDTDEDDDELAEWVEIYPPGEDHAA